MSFLPWLALPTGYEQSGAPWLGTSRLATTLFTDFHLRARVRALAFRTLPPRPTCAVRPGGVNPLGLWLTIPRAREPLQHLFGRIRRIASVLPTIAPLGSVKNVLTIR